jgi:hypothetical protein
VCSKANTSRNSTIASSAVIARVAGILGRTLELLWRDLGDIAAEARIIVKLVPRNRIFIAAHAEETAESSDRVNDAAADLIDDEALDFANVLTGGVEDRRAFNAFAIDQA